MEPSKVIEFDAARHRRVEAGNECGGRVSVQEVQDLMWRQVGLFRDREGLTQALAVLDPAWRAIDARIAAGEPLDAAGWREASILTVSRLIARAALRRSDFPKRDDIHWKRRASETRETNSIKD
jgi:succinate dehydrogenase/fumarate reductase flavoprotein subunit